MLTGEWKLAIKHLITLHQHDKIAGRKG